MKKRKTANQVAVTSVLFALLLSGTVRAGEITLTGESGDLEISVTQDLETTLEMLQDEYEALLEEVDTYEKYAADPDRTAAFYQKIYLEHGNLCIRMREYSLEYAALVTASEQTRDEKYEALEEIYDCVYDDAGDDLYDGIYDGILDDIYDDYYDGILEEGYDTAPYKEWSALRSEEYKHWADARSDVYGEWADMRSEVYEFWSDMRSAVWNDDMEKAEKKMKKFRKKIDALKEELAEETGSEISAPEIDPEWSDGEKKSEESTEAAALQNAGEELTDGMRPSFKEAMNSYEAFYDKYCDFMKKYQENPSDLTMLGEYSAILSESAVMAERFEAWDEEEMNEAELNYYLEVNSRVLKKLAETADQPE